MKNIQKLLRIFLGVFTVGTAVRAAQSYYRFRADSAAYAEMNMDWQQAWYSMMKVNLIFYAVVAGSILLILIAMRISKKQLNSLNRNSGTGDKP